MIRFAQDSKNRSVQAERRLNAMGSKPFFCFFIIIRQVGAAFCLCGRPNQNRCDTPTREALFCRKDNHSKSIVLLSNGLCLPPAPQVRGRCFCLNRHPKANLKFPFRKLSKIFSHSPLSREIFYFHLLKFSSAEKEVSWRNFISESLCRSGRGRTAVWDETNP